MFPKHALVAFQGDWATADATGEVWQFGVRVSTGDPHGDWLSDPQAYCAAIATPIATWFGAASTGMVSSARLRTLKVNNINPDGSYADPNTHLHDYGAGVFGAAAPVGDMAMSLAITWESNEVSRGPGARGRIYPPNAGYGMNGAFTVTNASATAAANAGKALLNLLLAQNDAAGFLVTPVISSRTSARAYGIGHV